ncbi:MAG: hypothetical protein DMF87_21320 [Acidobacteria bacterium]|nr:MAG: hypothetical protein DMF87_21320 [Acidobacteriota bacterium]
MCGRRFSTITRSGTSRSCSGAGGLPVPRDESGNPAPLRFPSGPHRTWSDARLIRGCLKGDDRELPRLRKQAAFRGWLITITAHASLKWKRKQQRRPEDELTAESIESLETEPLADLIEEVEREQALREAVAQLSPRCQELITMLFYREPPLPYRDVAQTLGLATGSIGFIRGRCLKRLERFLAAKGFWT